jgi:hypothetical protein
LTTGNDSAGSRSAEASRSVRGGDSLARTLAGASLFAVVFLALHLPYLPASLEDLDSINFALGIRQFDVSRHQPHPPGYPVYIAVAKAAHAIAGSEVRALGLISVLSGTLGVIAVAWLFDLLSPDDRTPLGPLAAAALVMSSPLYWVTAARPLSDVMGLAAAVAVQAMAFAAVSTRGLVAASFCAGLAAGIRSQVLWLTVPLVAYRCLTANPRRDGAAIPCGVAFLTGILAWFVPMVVATGGLDVYRRALVDQGAEDLSGVRMLWTTPTPRALADTLYYGFIAPWATWPTAIVVLGFACAGLVALQRRQPAALGRAVAAFGPYIAFDMLFQEFVTVRYALPIVLPIAWLAAAGLRSLPGSVALPATLAIVMFNAHVGGRSIAALSRVAAPVFRALEDMRTAAGASAVAVLAPDRRQSLDLRRPLLWLGADAPAVARQLPAPPQHEWLEAVKYWDGGGRAPVWFVVDPRRAAMDLVQHGDPVQYRWSLPYPVVLSGTRPNDLDWYRVDRPEWYVGEGWSLTPESAGVAEADRRGLAFRTIEGGVRRDAASGALLLGGRNFDPAVRPKVSVRIGGQTVVVVTADPGPFLFLGRLKPPAAEGSDYLPITVTADPPARLGVEQFDASASRGLVGFGPGWHERELNPVTGQTWRWVSDRGELRYLSAGGGVLRIEGESSRKYYSKASRLVVRLGERILSDTTVSTDFRIDVAVPAAAEPATLIVETDQIHVPADSRWRRTGDRRRLGLRIFRCELR